VDLYVELEVSLVGVVEVGMRMNGLTRFPLSLSTI